MGISLSAGALKVLGERYLRKGPDGRVSETPEEMFRRVASNIAGAEKNPKDRDRYAGEFFRVMSGLEFLPNSPALMNAGRRLQQLAACFVLPVDDSLDSIFEAVKETALIHQSGGGTGFSFSRLRPANDMVGSTGGTASGPVSFMRVFNAATEAIKQGGTRRGANMGVLRIDHPDIISFITAKENPAEFTNFNLSVAVTDEFMDAVEKNEGYRLVNPRTGKAVGEKRSAEVFDLLALSAWRNGEPGVIFIDAVNRANPTPEMGAIEATNPCGEQPLLSHEPCILGSVNLSRMLKKEEKGRFVDYRKLEDTVRLGVRFLDNAVDMGRYPVPEIERMAKGNRKIGLGVMGFADMLAKMRIPYASDEGFKTGEEVMRFIRDAAWDESRRLAGERGAFPNISRSVFDRPGREPVRNATVTTIAPTGTLSIIAGCSSGIEPFFSLSFTRRVLNGVELPELNAVFLEAAEDQGFMSEGLKAFVSKGGAIKDREDVPPDIKKAFPTAFDISPEGHVRMQAAFQRHTDNAVSKTINLSPDSSPDDVRQAYLLAHRLGCKGITVYRTGTRAGQVLTCKNTLYC